MRKQIVIFGASAMFTLTLLGAGCRKTAPAPPPAAPAANAPAAPDPLADNLDAAIEDLNAIE